MKMKMNMKMKINMKMVRIIDMKTDMDMDTDINMDTNTSLIMDMEFFKRYTHFKLTSEAYSLFLQCVPAKPHGPDSVPKVNTTVLPCTGQQHYAEHRCRQLV
jgi:hypothetical protein